jgi:hypothetical protein
MERYDPERAPPPADWLALDEGERIHLIEVFHRDARVPLPKAARAAHASIHAVVENQLALYDEPIVRALARLMKEGLSRHDAVHAIGSVLVEGIYDVVASNDPGDTFRARYYAAVERLSAVSWRANRDD